MDVPIAELALDLRWSRSHSGDRLWRTLDSELWDATQNPWLILQAISRDRLQSLLAQPDYRDQVNALLDRSLPHSQYA